MSNNMDVLQWLASKGFVPDAETVTTWILEDPDPYDQYTTIDILNWLETEIFS